MKSRADEVILCCLIDMSTILYRITCVGNMCSRMLYIGNISVILPLQLFM